MFEHIRIHCLTFCCNKMKTCFLHLVLFLFYPNLYYNNTHPYKCFCLIKMSGFSLTNSAFSCDVRAFYPLFKAISP